MTSHTFVDLILNDLPAILQWWLGMFIVGIAFQPFGARLFQGWPDRGYPFAKPLGMLLGGYSCWLLSALGMVPFGRGSVIAVILAWGAAGIAFPEGRSAVLDLFRTQRRLLVTREALFVFPFLLWVIVRGQNPDINGLEKFMDFGFVNACLRSPFMPPPDPWFAGETINYYYFGHFIGAWLITLTNVPPDVGYNLAISTLFALTFSLSFSLLSALIGTAPGANRRTSRLVAGLTAALLATCGGNGHAFWKWLLPLVGVSASVTKPFHYPDSTRFIGYDPATDDKTIHEFPLYSFIVADLHGHVVNLVFVLLFIGLLFAGWRRFGGRFTAIPVWPLFPLYALCLAVFSMTNTWDVPIYLLLMGVTVLLSGAGQVDPSGDQRGESGEGWGKWAWELGVRGSIILLGFPLFAYPFARSFRNFSDGVGLAMAHTAPVQILILWGFHLLIAGSFLVWLFWPRDGVSRIRETLQTASPADRFCLAMIVTAAALIAIPEVLYVKDIYGVVFHRCNTMFKLTFQAFLLLSLLGGYVFERVYTGTTIRALARAIRVFHLLCLSALLLYGIPAIHQHYGGVSLDRYRGLEGLNFLDAQGPGDLATVKWFRQHVSGQPCIIEANGDSYSPYARISMATGLPTPLGWFVHQRLWRGDWLPCVGRAAQVSGFYRLSKLKLAHSLLDHYQIRYIIVGALERKKFPMLDLDFFKTHFREVFQSGDTHVFAYP